MILTKLELQKISGGATKWGLAAIIGSATAFIVGIIDGFLKPKKCNT